MNYNENVCLFLILEVYWNIGDETILFIRKDFPFVSTTVAQRWNQCTSLPKLSNVIPSLSSAFGHMLTLEAFQYLAFKNSKNRSFCKSNILKKKKAHVLFRHCVGSPHGVQLTFCLFPVVWDFLVGRLLNTAFRRTSRPLRSGYNCCRFRTWCLTSRESERIRRARYPAPEENVSMQYTACCWSRVWIQARLDNTFCTQYYNIL